MWHMGCAIDKLATLPRQKEGSFAARIGSGAGSSGLFPIGGYVFRMFRESDTPILCAGISTALQVSSASTKVNAKITIEAPDVKPLSTIRIRTGKWIK
jgi:hypothetical protein